MKLVYVDSSALVTIYVGEPTAHPASSYLLSCPKLISSLLTYGEVLAVLNRHRRERRVRRGVFETALSALNEQFREAFILPLDLARLSMGRVCYDHPLKGADAIHLALALEAAVDAEVEMATFDKALARESARAGLGVWPLMELR